MPETVERAQHAREDVAECIRIVDELFPPLAREGHRQTPLAAGGVGERGEDR